MSDDEVRRWVTGPRLDRRGNPYVDKTPMKESLAAMNGYAKMYQGDVRGENAKKIAKELERRLLTETEMNKQTAYAVTEVMESKGLSGEPGHGPADKIRGFLGVPPVKKRDGGRKTKKNSKRTRRLRRRTHKRLL